MILRLLASLAFSLLALTPPAHAHEIRPAYLQIDELAPQRYELLWKVPTNAGMVQNIIPKFDPRLTLSAQSGETIVNGFVIFRYSLTGDTALPGTTLTIDNLDNTTIDTLVNISMLDGTHRSFLLRPRENSVLIPETPSAWQGVKTYTRLGIEHILRGIDHLLFVFGLMLIVSSGKMLFKTITSFTIAHSITLGIATLGYAHAPLPPLNAAIAMSILFLGPEIVRVRRGKTSLTIRYPWLIAFGFGLLHGFGFASGLSTAGVPQAELPWALLSFNVGVELGQLFFVFVSLSLAWAFRVLQIRWPRWVLWLPAYTVGTLGAFWTIQRTAMLLRGL